MGFYARHVFPHIINMAMKNKDATRLRETWVPQARGEVLEIGARSLQTAHRIGASTVMEHFRHMPRHAVLLTSTCAGAEVRRDWIDTMVYQRLLATLDPSRP